MNDIYLNQAQFANLLDVSPSTLYLWLKEPAMDLPTPVPFGRRKRWLKGDVSAWLEARQK